MKAIRSLVISPPKKIANHLNRYLFHPVRRKMVDYQSCSRIVPGNTPSQRKSLWYKRIRANMAYFFFGICNNFGYIVMLTAAADIISEQTGNSEHTSTNPERNCTYMSTGAILLADILPALTTKIFAPFLPFFIHVRVAMFVVFAAAGYACVANSTSFFMSLLGIMFTSFCAGFGELTFLQYSSYYDRKVISFWSSGTGVAGVAGALSYTILRVVGFKTTLMIMIVIPVIMGFSFWVLLPKPSEEDIAQALEIQKIVNKEELANPSEVLKKKLRLIPGLMKYIVPFALVYIFEYFINQGIFELMYFENSSLTKAEQYRWFSVTYQIGVFISRSSVSVYHIKNTWIMAILQAINVVIFTTEVVYFYLPGFWLAIAIILWEGLLGGFSYVNTFYRISNEVPEEDKQFSMAITTFGDSIGIALAGVLAIFAHNQICGLPMPK